MKCSAVPGTGRITDRIKRTKLVRASLDSGRRRSPIFITRYAPISQDIPLQLAITFTERAHLPKQPLPQVIKEEDCGGRQLYHWVRMRYKWTELHVRY